MSEDAEDPIIFSAACPNLRYLTLSGIPLTLTFPRPTIINLKLKDMPGRALLSVIRQCPSVIRMTITESPSDFDSDLPTICHSNIQRLTLEFVKINFLTHLQRDRMHAFVRSLTVSPLTHLTLWAPNDALWKYHAGSLCTMLNQSQCILTHLTIHVIPLKSNDLIHLFRCVPLLTDLRVEQDGWYASDEAASLALRILVSPDPLHDGWQDNFAVEIAKIKQKRTKEFGVLDAIISLNNKIEVSEGEFLLPRLKYLALDFTIRPCGEMLLALVYSRWRPSISDKSCDNPSTDGIPESPDSQLACLKSLEIQYRYESDTEYSKNWREDLEQFQKDGMNIELIVW
ncbi:hypothetical protein BDP27DRAFT_1414182 [Rhodocollybia butyracea]|uniref:Uncharacterized protein n=1 Tax=Rhodocollybia butyracea TaxID=206335 RepID=A0A9P5UF97_9AGAR|nr:hypothetical protein BDP27DRAFT_1414182 [Rhodocollybia butyracea]